MLRAQSHRPPVLCAVPCSHCSERQSVGWQKVRPFCIATYCLPLVLAPKLVRPGGDDPVTFENSAGPPELPRKTIVGVRAALTAGVLATALTSIPRAMLRSACSACMCPGGGSRHVDPGRRPGSLIGLLAFFHLLPVAYCIMFVPFCVLHAFCLGFVFFSMRPT